ncbi:hypothetical protein TSUD_105780 [Trifolium subterraneum]|uniref:B box-type domain-containing protein n=1 Tax=Trifolium subterraneum TaxID=3900 RepID=A0A2Z6M4Z0_TRISU|nr:hypothetical protein TSUD_105780 [Trifolium subterraneum]
MKVLCEFCGVVRAVVCCKPDSACLCLHCDGILVFYPLQILCLAGIPTRSFVTSVISTRLLCTVSNINCLSVMFVIGIYLSKNWPYLVDANSSNAAWESPSTSTTVKRMASLVWRTQDGRRTTVSQIWSLQDMILIVISPAPHVEDARGFAVKGDLDVHSVFATSLRTSHPSFSPQRVPEISETRKASALPKHAMELFLLRITLQNGWQFEKHGCKTLQSSLQM